MTLDKAIFGLEPNHELLGLAYRAYLANGRTNNAATLTRGLVRGGGKKPWRQKGTGRARVGSSRVPNWRGGGITFGPSGQENYTVNVPVKMKRLAIRQALSAQVKDGKVSVIEAFAAADGKVKTTVALLEKLKTTGKVLLVVAGKNDLLERSTRNIASLNVQSAKYVNVFTLLNADQIIITSDALDMINNWLKPAAGDEK